MNAEPTLATSTQTNAFANKLAFATSPQELNRRIAHGDSLAIVDVREPEEFAMGHVPGAINLSPARWASLEGLRKDGMNVVYGASRVSPLAGVAAVGFAAEGFLVLELEGGFQAWKECRLPVER